MYENKSEASARSKAPESLSPAELARRWGICRQSVYNMINAGELRSFKPRNCRRISLSEVERIERCDS